MERQRLAALLERPEVQQMILGDYDGGYSVGLTKDPDDAAHFAIRVRVEGKPGEAMPSQVVLDGDKVRVIINGNFVLPEALTACR